ncbi:MAG: class I SAM-dependent methyltransferase [Methanoregula sp.]|uniref:class I SAM-dependent methyltransferase n=1 Tax=Methanoregula sp. TaxID=2052170 RepID=UPI003BB12169
MRPDAQRIIATFASEPERILTDGILTSQYSDPFWKTPSVARQYGTFANTDFVRIYPVIANQILDRTGITDGTCLDIGSGPGSLAIALATLSGLNVTALDSSPEMFELAQKNICKWGIEQHVTPVIGDVHAIPAPDATFHLVVSRGSYHFWNDLPVAFSEVFRVLKPGGMAYIGGGYGSARIRDEILAKRKKRGIIDNPEHPTRTRFRKFRAGEIEESIETAGITDYRIINDDSGFWIIFRKV